MFSHSRSQRSTAMMLTSDNILALVSVALTFLSSTAFVLHVGRTRQRASKPQSTTTKYKRKLEARLNPTSSSLDDGPYDVIVVGTGNGGCALLSECLKYAPKNEDYKILCLEQGQNFFFTSDVTHENGWSKTYSSGSIFKLHNSMTPGGRSIISGRAVTMGGGGRYAIAFYSKIFQFDSLTYIFFFNIFISLTVT